MSGCVSVTMYWCWTGSTGMSRPIMAPVAAREVARCGDDVLRDPVTLVGSHEPFATGSLFDSRHAGLAMDDRALRTGAPGQGLGEVRRLDVAVVGMADGADKAVGDRQGPDLAYVVGP